MKPNVNFPIVVMFFLTFSFMAIMWITTDLSIYGRTAGFVGGVEIIYLLGCIAGLK